MNASRLRPGRDEVRTRNPIHLFTPRAVPVVSPTGATPSGRRSELRRMIVAVTGAITALVLTVGFALPSPPPALPQTAALAALVPEQSLSGRGAVGGASALDVISPVEVLPERRPGAPSLAGIDESPTRYPFDAQVTPTDTFGYRTAPVAQFHDAQDYGAAEGTPIKVVASGVVLEAGPTTDGCGFGLKVQHNINGRDVTSRYCHMQTGSNSYRPGDRVRIGAEAGRVGMTGMAFGANLHLAMRQDDVPIDPVPFLSENAK